MAKNAPFIGTDALVTLARSITPEIAMSAYYDRKAIFDKFGIAVISGIQFQNIKYLLLRKTHTTRRKHVGDWIRNTAGKLIERPLTTYLAWNRYWDNQDSYREFPLVNENNEVSYPGSEQAIRLVLANYKDDIYDCVWHGDHTIEGDEAGYLGLFDGFYTNIKNDVEAGYVHPISLSGVITPVTDTTDTQAWLLFKEFINKWDVRLRGAAKVIVATNTETAEAIVDAYGNSKNNNKEANVLPNGNYSFPVYPNIELAHDTSLGLGTKLIAYTPGNLEYGVDTENAENGCEVQFGSDKDAKDIIFQPQTAQGTRVFNITAGNFACTDAPMAPVSVAGDAMPTSTYAVGTSNAELGTVTVNGEAADNTVEYAAGTTLALKAEATETGKFVKWSNGSTEAEISVVTTGRPEGVIAIFAPKA